MTNFSGGGKMEKPNNKRTLCWCGNPECPGEKDGWGPPIGFGVFRPGSPPPVGFSSENLRPNQWSPRLDERMRDMLRESMENIDIRISPDANEFFRSVWPESGPESEEDEEDEGEKEPPYEYEQARTKVEKWLNTAPPQTFDDIVGNDEALAQIRDAIRAPVTHKELYAAYGMKMPKGALLSGPPGCGKTMFARAAASEMKELFGSDEFICLSGGELQSPYIGVTEGYIKDIFNFAKEYKTFKGHPLLVFIDEADVLFPDRTGRVRKVASWEESQVATFLAEMDGVQESCAFVMLATNRPEVMDQALLRDGRCDFKIQVKRPNIEAVEVILKKGFGKVLVSSDSSVDELTMVALEGLLDPHKVIVNVSAIKGSLDKNKEVKFKDLSQHFLLEHIVSGAMVVAIPERAKRHAFMRDKESGVATGISAVDVHKVINEIFQENKGLDHSFAMKEFIGSIVEKAEKESG